MDKKAEFSIPAILMISIGAILVAYLFIPQVQQSTNTFDGSDSLVKAVYNANETFSLSNTPLVASSLSISGLTLTTNYTVDYNAGTVRINDVTKNKTYTAVYEYVSSRYIDSASDRVLYGVLITLAIVGLLYMIARLFGLA